MNFLEMFKKLNHSRAEFLMEHFETDMKSVGFQSSPSPEW